MVFRCARWRSTDLAYAAGDEKSRVQRLSRFCLDSEIFLSTNWCAPSMSRCDRSGSFQARGWVCGKASDLETGARSRAGRVIRSNAFIRRRVSIQRGHLGIRVQFMQDSLLLLDFNDPSIERSEQFVWRMSFSSPSGFRFDVVRFLVQDAIGV